jgi:hypothetical protein
MIEPLGTIFQGTNQDLLIANTGSRVFVFVFFVFRFSFFNSLARHFHFPNGRAITGSFVYSPLISQMRDWMTRL